jgi:hypothetical protein
MPIDFMFSRDEAETGVLPGHDTGLVVGEKYHSQETWFVFPNANAWMLNIFEDHTSDQWASSGV